ncbi:MAG: hypothetical protein ACFE0O_12810 [Opitutales bacterium]
MLTRKLGKWLRGNPTRGEVLAACIGGCILGALPGLGAAPATYLLLFVGVLLINLNLFVFGLSAVLSWLVTWPLQGLVFWLGSLVLDSPLGALFIPLINGPVTAWMGLERYRVVGAILFGIFLGMGFGFLLHAGVTAYSRKIQSFGEDDPRLARFTGNRALRILGWVFFGGGLRPNPNAKHRRFRITGLVVAGGLGLIVGASLWFLDDAVVRAQLHNGLERTHGATVDLDSADLDLGAASLSLSGLALADRDNLTRNLFSADTLTLDIDTSNLLARKWVVDRLEVNQAALGDERRVPGRILAGPKPVDKPGEGIPVPSVEEVAGAAGKILIEGVPPEFETARIWLQRIRGWLGGKARTETGEPAPKRVYEDLDLVASRLIRDHPRLLIRSLHIDPIRWKPLDNLTLSLEGENLSTALPLQRETANLRVQSADDRINLQVTGRPPETGETASPATLSILFSGKNLPVAAILDALNARLPAQLNAESLAVQLAGTLTSEAIDLPVTLTFREATVSREGLPTLNLSRLEIPVVVAGTPAAPTLTVNASFLLEGVKSKVREEGEKLLKDKLGDKLPFKLPGG